jgi:hypothetical protein
MLSRRLFASIGIVAVVAAITPVLAQAQRQASTKEPQANVLPAEMLGSWGREEDDCTDIQSESRLHVTAKRIDFADNRLTVSKISSQKQGWWRIDGMNREEGKRGTRRASLELRLQGKDRLLLRSGPGKPEDFVRCKPTQLQG